MIKPEQIPLESAKAVYDLFDLGYLESIGLHPDSIVAAAINAWPGGSLQTHWNNKYWLDLPLPQEKNDD